MSMFIHKIKLKPVPDSITTRNRSISITPANKTPFNRFNKYKISNHPSKLHYDLNNTPSSKSFHKQTPTNLRNFRKNFLLNNNNQPREPMTPRPLTNTKSHMKMFIEKLSKTNHSFHKETISKTIDSIINIKSLSQTISQELANKFSKSTIDMNDMSLINDYKTYKQFQKKVLNDFNTSNLLNSKQNYNQIILFDELKHEMERKKGEQTARKFYERQKSSLGYDAVEKASRKSIKINEIVKMHNKEIFDYAANMKAYYRTKRSRVKKEVDDLGIKLVNLDCAEYEPLFDNKKRKCHHKINENNLQRAIKMVIIKKCRFDSEDNDIGNKNIPLLKDNVVESSKMVQQRLKNYIPRLMKSTFKPLTVFKMKASTGQNFGVP